MVETENMYTNIPTSELKTIIENIMTYDNHMSMEEKEELLMTLNMIIQQSYFQFNKQFFKQNEGH
jgi:hypothetical protein